MNVSWGLEFFQTNGEFPLASYVFLEAGSFSVIFFFQGFRCLCNEFLTAKHLLAESVLDVPLNQRANGYIQTLALSSV